MSEPRLFRIQDIDSAVLAHESERVVAMVRSAIVAGEVHLVGSTAISGVIGKQDIDVLVRVAQADFPAARHALDAVFARNPGQLSNDEFQGYVVTSQFDAAVQLTVANGQYDDFLAFREALRANPDLVAAYNDLKRQFDGRPMEDYRCAKDEFIQAALARPSKERFQ